MLQLEKTTSELLEIEDLLLNSNPFYNRLSKNKDALTAQEIALDNQESEALGAERFLLKDGEQYIGTLDYLPKNPGDGCTWLGLLLIDKKRQRAGYGAKAFPDAGQGDSVFSHRRD